MVNNISKLKRIGEKEKPSLRRVYKNNKVCYGYLLCHF